MKESSKLPTADDLLKQAKENERTYLDTLCENAVLRARVAELEAGAARYRWLRDRNTGQDKIASARIMVDDGHPPCWELKHGEDLDRAIDAARLSGNKPASLPKGGGL